MEPEGLTQPLLEGSNYVTEKKQHLTVFVAVPVQEEDTMMSRLSSHDEDELLQKSNTMTSEDSDEYYNYYKSTESQTHHQSSFRFASIMIGFLTGCFLQLSSLGTNFVVTTLPWMHQYKETLFILSLCWTSVLGITVFRIATVLLSKTRTLARVVTVSQSSLAWSEPTMAIASLVGVCLSWIVTDLVLGFHVQFMHYIVSLLVPTAWCKFISFFVNQVDAEDGEEEDQDGDDQDSLEHKRTSPSDAFKWYGLGLGWIIGLLIQYASLGASFVLNTWSLVNLTQNIHALEWDDRTVLLYSMVWSFLTNGMGVAILYYFRRLILTHYYIVKTRRTAEDGQIITALMNLVFDLECYFAFGALAGVNMGWISTEAILGLPFGWEKHMLLCLLGIAFCRLWMAMMHRREQEQITGSSISSIPREVITIV